MKIPSWYRVAHVLTNLLLLGLPGMLLAQPYALVQDSFPWTPPWASGTVRGTDGILFERGSNWYAFDAAGSPQWAMLVSPAFSITRHTAGLPDGGLMHTAGLYPVFQGSDYTDPDTATLRFQVARFDQNGSLIYRKELTRTFIDYDLEFAYIEGARVVPYGTSGGIYHLGVSNPQSQRALLHVIKLDPAGNLLWARTLGNTYNGQLQEPDVGLNYIMDLRTDVSADESLTLMYAPFGGGPPPHHIIRLDPNGNLVYANEYDYASLTSNVDCHCMSVDSANNVLTACQLSIFNTAVHWMLLENDGTGQLTKATWMEWRSGGGILVGKADNGSNVFVTNDQIYVDPGSGGSVSYYQHRRSSMAPLEYWNWNTAGELVGDTLHMMGLWNEEDTQFGLTNSGMSITKVPITGIPSCDWKDTVLSRTDVPLNLFVTTALTPSWTVLNVDQEWTVSTDTTVLNITPIALPTMIDRCSFFTGVPEQETRELMLFPSPVDGNGVLFLDQQAGDRYRILDMSGRLVATGRAASSTGRWSIPLPGLEPGLYLLDVLDAGGLRTGAGRFVVE